MIKASEIRNTFTGYYKSQGHEHVKSASLVPHNDPTLMFTSAGMVQFKNLFTGQEKRNYTRATTAQKCLRAGGKHNDLDNVGFTARHHTFFEMLGNFSFGDYFKEDAINYAWNVVTKEFGVDKSRLLVTIYHTDDEAYKIWKKVAGLSDDKIIRISTSDNFWSAGDTGPCGPCTEIFYDHGDKLWGGPPGSPEEDGDRFIEIWNLVFMQYEQLANGERVNLPKPSIDTGMGLERISALLQGSHDNYDVDMIRALIEASANLTSKDADGEFNVSHRIIADHLRASGFMIADGILPSNEGRGYVLRRIMRRAMRHAHLLGATDPLMYRLVPELVKQMGETYPELIEAQPLIEETLKVEENRFKGTLENGLGLLYSETDKLGSDEKLSGEVAFKLYDTYGFPLDLTQDVLKREQKREVDVEGFNAAMEEQRAKARAAWKGSGEAAVDQVWFDIKEKNGSTEFLGYDLESTEGQIVALVNAKGQVVSSLKDEEGMVVTNQTSFYGESGGQVGDTGVIETKSAKFTVTDTQKKLGSLFVHMGKVKGEVKVGDEASLKIDIARRNDIRANHSATHLLHAALHRHVGNTVNQKGSAVDENRLRFDVSYNKPITDEQIKLVEDEVNARIRMNTEVTTRLLGLDDAKAMGAMAMFGEKYDDEVRMISMGGKDPDGKKDRYSIELCGGTHVRRTGDIGAFKLISESALAAGVRRIEAVTGRGAMEYLSSQDKIVRDVAQTFKAPAQEIMPRIESLMADKRQLEKQVSELRRKLAAGGTSSSGADVKKAYVMNAEPMNFSSKFGEVKFTYRILHDFPAKDLKPLADELKRSLGSGVVALISSSKDGKVSIVVGVTADLTAELNAVDLVKIGAEKLGGAGGGGRPDMAQAGGSNASAANDAISAIESAIAK